MSLYTNLQPAGDAVNYIGPITTDYSLLSSVDALVVQTPKVHDALEIAFTLAEDHSVDLSTSEDTGNVSLFLRDTDDALTIQSPETVITSATLGIEAPVVHLACDPGAQLPLDGVANSGAGIQVDGFPSAGNASFASRYEKSIKWHNNTDGVLGMGNSSPVDEPYWEVKGGGMRMTYINPSSGDEISYGFRINNSGELE